MNVLIWVTGVVAQNAPKRRSKITCHLNKFQGRTPKPHTGGCHFAAGRRVPLRDKGGEEMELNWKAALWQGKGRNIGKNRDEAVGGGGCRGGGSGRGAPLHVEKGAEGEGIGVLARPISLVHLCLTLTNNRL